ncbi:MAG: hypothetical protein EOO03_12760 [Chitinophagaceae bacterium]|nr:MAG: hypothetical protein EOO03_12760 [Chitinophagaceae bacterium]
MSYPFCPNCGIGLNNSEVRVGACNNCKSFFETEDIDYLDENNQPVNSEEPQFDEHEVEFNACPNCDGHPACEDFGCAIEHGLGHMVQPDQGDIIYH